MSSLRLARTCLSRFAGSNRDAVQLIQRTVTSKPTPEGTVRVWKNKVNDKYKVKLKDGHVSSALSGGRYYVGEFLNGVPHGRGHMLHNVDKRFQYSDLIGSILQHGGSKFYDGLFENGQYHGFGQLTYPNGQKLTGEFKRGRMHNGEGVTLHPDNSAYEGSYKDGFKHGRGIIVYASGRILSGEFREGFIFTGSGSHETNGCVESGEWKSGHFKGSIHDANGVLLETKAFTESNGVVSSVTSAGVIVSGAIIQQRLFSKGKMVLPNGVCLEGTFCNNKLHGQGTITQPDGRVLRGEFRNGRICNGSGVFVGVTGKVKAGVWVEGVLVMGEEEQ